MVVVLVAEGRVTTASSRVWVVVVETAGSFTTVVQEVKIMVAAAITGARRISFFIVG